MLHRGGEKAVRTERAVRHGREQRHAFRIHAGVFAAGMIVIFVVNLATSAAAGTTGEWGAWWSAWAFVGWGLGIVTHGLVVWLNRPSTASIV